ncbi:glutamine amidotransferase subunit pdxT [Morchella snyderi]|nr:glutamine amidotransferase subunit pdxT [Morchella snyderi]
MSPIVSSRDTNAEYLLIGAYIRYSSWTARIVAILEHFKIPYSFSQYNKADPNDLQTIHSQPARLVPTLTVPSLGPNPIHDSLAITEFLAESHPTLPLWPVSRRLRALARSFVAEFHSGFGNLRNNYHTNYVARYVGSVPMLPGAVKEVARFLECVDLARRETLEVGVEGPYMFGSFGAADAFYWPVLWRLRTYGFDLSAASPLAREWIMTMWKDPVLVELGRQMFVDAENPESMVPEYENIFPGNAEMVRFDDGVAYVPSFE